MAIFNSYFDITRGYSYVKLPEGTFFVGGRLIIPFILHRSLCGYHLMESRQMVNGGIIGNSGGSYCIYRWLHIIIYMIYVYDMYIYIYVYDMYIYILYIDQSWPIVETLNLRWEGGCRWGWRFIFHMAPWHQVQKAFIGYSMVRTMATTVMAMATSYNWWFQWDNKDSINGVTC